MTTPSPKMDDKEIEAKVTDLLIQAMRLYGVSETNIGAILAKFWQAVDDQDGR